MDTLNKILNKFDLSYSGGYNRPPIEIPNFGRDQMAELFTELGYTKGAEIGTEQGVYAEALLKANPKLFLYCVDAWQAYREYRDHTRQSKLDNFYEITKERLLSYRYRSELIRSFSMDALDQFGDNSLDFVYIDANHDFINVTQDIYYWSKKVRKGGIISGHDFVKRKNEAAHVHIKQVLDGYTNAYGIKPWFVLGREAKINGEIRDNPRSWMFVKL